VKFTNGEKSFGGRFIQKYRCPPGDLPPAALAGGPPRSGGGPGLRGDIRTSETNPEGWFEYGLFCRYDDGLRGAGAAVDTAVACISAGLVQIVVAAPEEGLQTAGGYFDVTDRKSTE